MSRRIALHCIALHCIALHCIVLYCIVLHWEIYNGCNPICRGVVSSILTEGLGVAFFATGFGWGISVSFTNIWIRHTLSPIAQEFRHHASFTSFARILFLGQHSLILKPNWKKKKIQNENRFKINKKLFTSPVIDSFRDYATNKVMDILLIHLQLASAFRITHSSIVISNDISENVIYLCYYKTKSCTKKMDMFGVVGETHACVICISKKLIVSYRIVLYIIFAGPHWKTLRWSGFLNKLLLYIIKKLKYLKNEARESNTER